MKPDTEPKVNFGKTIKISPLAPEQFFNRLFTFSAVWHPEPSNY